MHTMTIEEIKNECGRRGLELKRYDAPHDYIYWVSRPGGNAAVFYEQGVLIDGVAIHDWDIHNVQPCTRELFDAKMDAWFACEVRTTVSIT